MNKRNFIKALGGIAAATPFATTATTSTKSPTSIRDPIWFTVYGTVFEIHQHHLTWIKSTPEELEASNISVSGLLAAKVGSKFEEGKTLVGYNYNQIQTTAHRFLKETKFGVSGAVYRVQSPVHNYGMVEVQSVYVTEQQPGQMITIVPFVAASIDHETYLISSDGSEYHDYLWKSYAGSKYVKVTSTVRGLV